MERQEYLGLTELANYIGWDRRKLAVYIQRGKVETSKAFAGTKSLWTFEQAERIKGALNGGAK